MQATAYFQPRITLPVMQQITARYLYSCHMLGKPKGFGMYVSQVGILTVDQIPAPTKFPLIHV